MRGVTSNPTGKLRAGQSARIQLALSSSIDALAVASQALVPSPGGYAVFVARSDKAQPTAVKIGKRSTGSVEILEGLNAGDTVITSNLLRLSPGTQISLVTVK